MELIVERVVSSYGSAALFAGFVLQGVSLLIAIIIAVHEARGTAASVPSIDDDETATD